MKKLLIITMLFLMDPVLGASQINAKYEYIVVTCGVFKTSDKAITKIANEYAQEGWELFFIHTILEKPILYFKRPVKGG